MGVAWVFETDQSARSVELSVEQAGAVLLGGPKTFKVDSTFYRPPVNIAGQISSFYLLHHSYFPESSFIIGAPAAMADNQTSSGRLPPLTPRATSDQGFDLILSKFSSGLVPENSTRFELIGNEYHLKDFRIRVGTVSSGSASAVKGVIVEFEYAPSNVLSQCCALLQEIVEFFFPGQTKSKPDVFLRQTQPDTYMAIDTLSQYLDIFLAMRRKA
uniref:Mediator of RNA polymerase II transcription subunit 20 n=1 Tax=Ditylenchus dipsaci TaxID=166011 RepID=A0A915DL82_9BILA